MLRRRDRRCAHPWLGEATALPGTTGFGGGCDAIGVDGAPSAPAEIAVLSALAHLAAYWHRAGRPPGALPGSLGLDFRARLERFAL